MMIPPHLLRWIIINIHTFNVSSLKLFNILITLYMDMKRIYFKRILFLKIMVRLKLDESRWFLESRGLYRGKKKARINPYEFLFIGFSLSSQTLRTLHHATPASFISPCLKNSPRQFTFYMTPEISPQMTKEHTTGSSKTCFATIPPPSLESVSRERSHWPIRCMGGELSRCIPTRNHRSPLRVSLVPFKSISRELLSTVAWERARPKMSNPQSDGEKGAWGTLPTRAHWNPNLFLL